MLDRAIRAVRALALRAKCRTAPAAAGAPEPQAPTADELLAQARAAARLEAAAIVVDTAIVHWRLLPALREWAIDYAASDPAGFAAFLVSAPIIHVSANGRALVSSPYDEISPGRARLH